MSEQKDPKRKFIIILSLILAGEVIFFLPFVIPRIFRPTLLLVFDISNFDLGTCFSVYGIVAMASYLLGGPIADRYSPRVLIATALWSTSFGGIILVLFPKASLLVYVYAYWGATTILLLWAAMIKATRHWGGPTSQGKAFGFLEGGRGLSAALVGTIALLIFGNLFDHADKNMLTLHRIESYQAVLLTTSIITFMIGVLVYSVLPRETHFRNEPTEKLYANLPILLKIPSVWLQAIIIICAYVGYKITDDYSLYANQVLGFSEVGSASLGSIALWLRPVFALFAGYFADQIKGINVILLSFCIMIIGSFLLYEGSINDTLLLTIFILGFTLIGVYGIRGIYFTILEASKIPMEYTGSAIGIISFIGFTPEVFMSPLMGYLLDNNPGSLGHQYVFFVLFVFSFIGFVASLMLKKRISN